MKKKPKKQLDFKKRRKGRRKKVSLDVTGYKGQFKFMHRQI